MKSLLAAGCMLAITPCAFAAEARVAVAANFALPANRLAEDFARTGSHTLTLSSGSTGKFYAQIKSGAPFDVLLSGDDETPRRLEGEKLAVPGSRFTYAIGRLVLWGPRARVANEEVLRGQQYARLAIANPRLAPYGAAARDTLQKLGLWEGLQGRLVQGENIAQTFQFVSSGNVELGFIALSQLREGAAASGAHWLVPENFHSPLRQDAALLSRGRDNAAARAFLDYLRSPQARDRILGFGYGLQQ